MSNKIINTPNPYIDGQIKSNIKKVSNRAPNSVNKWYDYNIGCGLINGERCIILKIVIIPVQYDPVTDIIKWAENINMEISYKKSQNINQSFNEQYDFIIFDSPPVPIFSEFRILCRKVDGVVLVLNAMRTRRQAALRAKLELEDAGAKLLGVIINKRKYYIPKWLYRKL